MAKLNTVVFSASIDNEDAIRQWIETVGEQAGVVRQALDDLIAMVNGSPHVSITLHADSRSDTPEATA